MPQNAFTFEEDDKQPSSGGFSWDSDKTAPPREEAKQANTSGSSAEPSTWEKLTRGYNPNVEDWVSKHPIAGPAVRLLDAAGGAGMSTPGSIIEMVRHPIDTAEGIGSSLAAWGKPETWKGALSVLPEALGQGIGSVAAGEALSVPSKMVAAKAGPAISGAREAVGAKIRTPEGALKPDVRLAAKAGGMAAGAGAGELVGHPWIGGYIGGRAGPRILQKVFPDSFDATRENIPYAGETSPPVSQAPAAPSVRRTPGQVAPDRIAQAPQERVPLTPMTPPTVNLPGGEAMRGPQPLLPASTAPEQASAGLPSVEGPAKPTGTALSRLEGLIREAAGTPPPLDPAMPLRDQPRPMMPARVSAGQQVSDVINKNTEPEAVRPLSTLPLQKNVKLRDMAKAMPPAEVPHRATVVHEGRTYGIEAANGKKFYEATKGDPATAVEGHNLGAREVNNAFVNLGGDVNKLPSEGQRFKIGNSNLRQRIAQWDWMLDQGHSVPDIVKAARQAPK